MLFGLNNEVIFVNYSYAIERYKIKYIENNLAKYEITFFSAIYIKMLFEIGKASVSELSKNLYVDKAYISRITKKLIEKNLVKLKISENDRRKQEICLSSKGLKMIPLIESKFNQWDKLIEEFIGTFDKNKFETIKMKISTKLSEKFEV